MRILRNAHMNESELEKVSMINYNVRKSIERRSVFAFAFLPSFFCPFMVFQLQNGKNTNTSLQYPAYFGHSFRYVQWQCVLYWHRVLLFSIWCLLHIDWAVFFLTGALRSYLYELHTHHITSHQTKPCTFANYCTNIGDCRFLAIFFIWQTFLNRFFSFSFRSWWNGLLLVVHFIAHNFAIVSFINNFSFFSIFADKYEISCIALV